MANKYSITSRTLFTESSSEVVEMTIQWLDDMTADEVNRWIERRIAAYLTEYCSDDCLDFGVTKQSIIDAFSQLAQTLNVLEKNHDTRAVTFKIVNTFFTVQVVYPKEELT